MRFTRKEKGWKFEVYLAKLPNGKCPAGDYLDSLEIKVKVKLVALINRMAEVGYISNTNQFKMLSEGLFEFKHGRPHHRILGYFSKVVPQRIVLTHGYQKQTNKTPRNQLNMAKYIRDEYEKELRARLKKKEEEK
jgi:phage-related protein